MKINLFIYKFYQKVILSLSVIIFSLPFFSQDSSHRYGQDKKISYHKIKIKKSQDEIVLNPQKTTSLMPGQKIFFKENKTENWKSAEILGIELSRRNSIEILRTDRELLKGDLIADCRLPKNWKKTTESLSVRSGKKTIFIPFRDILKINASQGLVISNLFEKVHWETSQISFYQRSSFESNYTTFEKVRWLAPKSDLHLSSYDLFTPPIIYIHEGKLTTRRPEAEVKSAKREGFGLEFLNASKAPYSFRLISWVGTTPYFEDLNSPLTQNSEDFTRNRLEVGKYYKRNPSWKPGKPSLVICEMSDKDRLLKIENFVVQQHKNSKTGGLRLVGRALVNDYLIGGEPFEINSLMTEVYAGDYTFEFTFSLPNIPKEKFTFSNKDVGKEYSFSGRKYSIMGINHEENSIEISKKDPRELEDTLKVFNY
jgi:hypothetical protein